MGAISLKLDEKMLVHMDETLKEHDYSTRTEFVRDAIREKLVSLERERLIQSFLRLRGKAKKRTSMSDSSESPESVMADVPGELPILPLRNSVFFPGGVLPLAVGRKKTIALIKEAVRDDSLIGVVSQRRAEDEDPGGGHSGGSPEEDPTPTVGPFEQMGPGLGGHPPGDLAHWGQQGQRTRGQLDGLVCNRGHPGVDQARGLCRIGRKGEIGEEERGVAQHGYLAVHPRPEHHDRAQGQEPSAVC